MPSFSPWPPQAKLVNPDGSATQAFLLLVQQLHADVKRLEAAGSSLTTRQASTQTQTNSASQTAAEAFEDTTGATTQERVSELTVDAGTAWTNGPFVTFTAAVSVGHVTASDSGPVFFGDFRVPYMNGEVRLVQIISAVETVLETVGFSADNAEGSITFAGFAYDAASAATGEVSYRVDVRTLGGILYGLGLRTHILRAP